jgi:hypothetical protein
MHILILSIWIIFHPVHVTLTSIDLVPGTDSLKMFIKIYYDDFLRDYNTIEGSEKVIEGQDLPLETVTRYLDEKVKIRINNKELKGKLLNMALNDNEVTMNLLYKSGRNPEKITIENRIMTTLYNDQANMVIMRIKDIEEGFRLTPEITEKSFDLTGESGSRFRK